MPVAVILGLASQDGSYLAEFLIRKKYHIVGTIRHAGDDLTNITNIKNSITLEIADLLQPESIVSVIKKYHPAEFYHLAAMTSPTSSWTDAYLVGQVTGLGPQVSLEAIRQFSPSTRFFHASTREIFGPVVSPRIGENTPLSPQNPYSAAKTYAHLLTRIYRSTHHLFAVNGILFNHESPRRPDTFVTRKITQFAAQTAHRRKTAKLTLRNLKSRRDWGFAGDYVQAMWLMLRAPIPKDYIIATGTLHSVADICRIAFGAVGLDWHAYVVEDSSPSPYPETPSFAGDSTAIKTDLGWEPRTSFKDLIEMMVRSDLDRPRSSS